MAVLGSMSLRLTLRCVRCSTRHTVQVRCVATGRRTLSVLVPPDERAWLRLFGRAHLGPFARVAG